VLTPEVIRGALLDFFPGVEVATTQHLSGCTLTLTIWRWCFRVSLKTEKVTTADQPGVATFSVTVRDGSETPSIQRQTLDRVGSLEELRTVIRKHHGTLMGIVAAIETACSPPVERGPPSIFDDPPEPPSE